MGRITGWGMGEPAKMAGRVFIFCFFFGILAGTVVGNLGFLEIPQALEGGGRAFWGGRSLLDFGNAVMVNRPWRMEGGSAEKFFYIGKERLGEGLAAWLLGLTVCAVPFFWALAVYMGFSLSWVVVCYTVQMGFLGLFGFFLSCFPQWLFYLPAWYLFIWQGLNRPARVRLLPSLLGLLLFCLGAGAEAFVNPVFLRML